VEFDEPWAREGAKAPEVEEQPAAEPAEPAAADPAAPAAA
jgi:hypothetical protein